MQGWVGVYGRDESIKEDTGPGARGEGVLVGKVCVPASVGGKRWYKTAAPVAIATGKPLYADEVAYARRGNACRPLFTKCGLAPCGVGGLDE